MLTCCAPFVNIQFLGSSLTFMMVRATVFYSVLQPSRPYKASQWQSHEAADRHGVQVYVWARRHQYVTLSFLGIFTFSAPYLPWVLLAFSVVLRSSPVVDLMGMLAGIGVAVLDAHTMLSAVI